MEKAAKIMDITKNPLCTRCWGRIFSKDVEGVDNHERGEYINQILIENSCENGSLSNNCYICHNIFQFLENGLIEDIKKNIEDSRVEFTTFLVGCRIPPEIIQKEDFIYDKMDLELESIKKEINREIGKVLSVKTGKEVNFDNPNVVILVDFKNNIKAPNLEFELNPLFIEGRYRKLIRGIPQTKWPCRKCKGKGCKYCDYTGKMYMESVEELISPQIIKEVQGTESKFHGAGREDIDVKMLGRGRPFVIEIKEPQKRTLDLENLGEEINIYAAGKVEVSNLKLVGKERRSQIKTSSTGTYKIYRAIVDLDKEVSNDDLKILQSLEVIEQRTPIRVSHRRADLIRIRRVRDLKVKKLDQETLELIIECEGGLYIKELISGDENRTQPSISSLLHTSAHCVELDVLEVKN